MILTVVTAQIALKEWAVVVEALREGEQLILVRKGGIRDPKGAFSLEHREFLLYPTLEHQKESLVRPEFRHYFPQMGADASDPNRVDFKICAGSAFCGQIRDPEQLRGLEKYHLWTPEFFKERMRYRPQAPTLVVVLRVYRLPSQVRHPVRLEYAGCKSWVPLTEAIPVEGAEPVVDNRRFRQSLEEITARF